jgi:hypothetical protein
METCATWIDFCKAGFIIGLIFCLVLLVPLTAAYLYGVFFVVAF